MRQDRKISKDESFMESLIWVDMNDRNDEIKNK